jgi:signal transduction histidine kinase
MEQRFRPETEATAFRIVQEALTNIAKHGHASSCRVHDASDSRDTAGSI